MVKRVGCQASPYSLGVATLAYDGNAVVPISLFYKLTIQTQSYRFLARSFEMPTKVAVITGGGTGIGREAALQLQADGWDVVVTGRRKDELEKAVAMGKPGGGKMLAVAADVTKEADVKRLFAETVKAFGRVDFLFNNAGMGAPAVPMEELSLAQWQAVVDVNLTASFLCAQEAIRHFKTQQPRGGRIVNNGSISAHAPRPQLNCLHRHQTCHHRPHQMHRARRPQAQYRLWSARRRQRRHQHGRPHEGGRSASQWADRARAGHGPRALRIGHPLYGVAATRRERAHHDDQGNGNAV